MYLPIFIFISHYLLQISSLFYIDQPGNLFISANIICTICLLGISRCLFPCLLARPIDLQESIFLTFFYQFFPLISPFLALPASLTNTKYYRPPPPPVLLLSLYSLPFICLSHFYHTRRSSFFSSLFPPGN